MLATAVVMLALAATAPPPVPASVDTLSLELSPRDVRSLDHMDPTDRSAFPIAVVEPGPPPRRLEGRVEVKGSFSRMLDKKALLIKLDPGMQWHGEPRLVVDSRATDGTLMRDWLTWDLWRALGMVTPDFQYMRVLINGQPRGPYLQVGWIGPDLFERRGLGRDGELYQPPDDNHCGDLTPASVVDPDKCWKKLSPRDDRYDSIRELVAAIQAAPLDSFDAFVDRVFEPESVINWFALNSIISNSDTYDKNYFLYKVAATGKWQILPFDFDLSQGRNYDSHERYPVNILNNNFSYWYPLEQGLPNPLHDKAVHNPALRKRIRDRIAELMGAKSARARPWRGWLAPARVDERISSLRRLLLPLLAEDPVLKGRQQQFEEDVGALRHYYRARLAYLDKMVVRDDAQRIRDEAEVELPAAGGETNLVDEAGFFLGTITTPRLALPAKAAPVRIDLRSPRRAPESLPPGLDSASCVQRSWNLASSVALKADLELDYLQEKIHLTEVGSKVPEEHRLVLFLRTGTSGTWTPLPTAVNAVANTLGTTGVDLPKDGRSWLVACVPAAH